MTVAYRRDRGCRAPDRVVAVLVHDRIDDMIRDNQTIRHSAMYSIIDTDWEMVKPTLTALCREHPGG